MTLPLSSAWSVSPAPRYAAMKVLRPITGVRRSSTGGVHLLFPPCLPWVESLVALLRSLAPSWVLGVARA